MLSPRVKWLMDRLEESQVITVEKPWGVEHMITTDEFILKVIRINPGERTSMQFHERKEEVIVPLVTGHTPKLGRGGVYKAPTGGRGLELIEGTARITPNQIHRSVGPALLLEVTTLDNDDVVRMADDHGRA